MLKVRTTSTILPIFQLVNKMRAILSESAQFRVEEYQALYEITIHILPKIEIANEESVKLQDACKLALAHLESSHRRYDIQNVLRKALGVNEEVLK